MNKLKIEIIKRVLLLDTEEELRKIDANVLDAISRELSEDDKEQEEFKKWKANKSNGVENEIL